MQTKSLNLFIRDAERRPLVLEEFDQQFWLAVVESVTVATDRTMTFRFRNGTDIMV